MSLLRLLLNIIWLFTGGLVMGLAWWLVGLLCFISIIGIPFGRACFVIGELSLWPFGQAVIEREYLTGKQDIGTGSLGIVGNIVWFLLFGFWLGLGHLLLAIASFITIIGIPFGLQHLKLAQLSLTPIGQTIVAKA